MISLSTQQEHARLRCLQEIKQGIVESRYPPPSPFASGIDSRSNGQVEPWHIPAIHNEVFDHLLEEIRQVHREKRPRIIPLIAPAGLGKSHLLARLNAPDLASTERFVLVRRLGAIAPDEVDVILLDHLLTALCHPSPNGPHLLLERLLEIAFNVLRQLVDEGNAKITGLMKRTRMQRLRSWFGRNVGPREIRKRLAERKPEVFALLDTNKFLDYAAQRLLPEPAQPFHRVVLRVLFRYLDPDERDAALVWLRGKQVESLTSDPVFRQETADTQYSREEVLKILLSLFAADISDGLRAGLPEGAVREADTESRVFVFTFDQYEGQRYLYKDDADWLRYFGRLADLYLHLNNVVFVFPCSPELFDRLHPRMEAAFQRIIPADRRFRLLPIRDEHAVDLYRVRLRHWLGQDADLRMEVCGQTLPLDEEQVKAIANETPVLRDCLTRLDREFREYFKTQVHADDPRVDFLYHLEQLKASIPEAEQKDHRRLESHPGTVTQLFNEFGAPIARLWGLDFEYLGGVSEAKLDGRLLTFRVPGSQQRVRVYHVFLYLQYRDDQKRAVELMKGTHSEKTFLFLVRHDAAPHSGDKPEQIFTHGVTLDQELSLQALLKVLPFRQRQLGERGPVDDLVRAEINQTYLGALFARVARAVEVLTSSAAPAVASENDLEALP